MLYKMIIVDDEEIFREGLANIIDWHSLGFEVVSTFEDGKEAIEFLKNNSIDLVITDIKMTFNSGLDIAEFIFSSKLETRTIIISGHREFEFAQKAIEFNVKHYLLKTFQTDELILKVKEVKNELDMLRNEKNYYDELLPLVQKQFFIDITMGVLKTESEIITRLRLTKLKIDPHNCLCCILCINIENFKFLINNKWQHGVEGLHNAIDNIISSYNHEIIFFPTNHISDKVYVFGIDNSNSSSEIFEQKIVEYIEILERNIKYLLSVTASIKLTQVFNNIFDIVNTKNEISFPENSANYTIEDILSSNERLAEQQKLLLSYINAGNINATKNIFEDLIPQLSNLDLRIIQNFVVDLFARINTQLRDLNVDIYVICNNQFSYEMIFMLKDATEVKNWGVTILNETSKYLSSHNISYDEDIIIKSKKYIKLHCCENINLDDVANHIYLSPDYLSRLFKQKTNETFTDYLIKERMNQAIKLLRKNQYKVYEVSSLVGYKSTKHFCRLFKQYTGFTPTEYRNNLFKESDD